MKKVVTILAMMFCTIIFTSCTDEVAELEERIENGRQFEVSLVEHGEVGDEQEDEQREK